MKRLYDVEIHCYVMAENISDAEWVATREVGHYSDSCDIIAYEANSVDSSWWDAIPFGGDDDRTCGQIIQAQKAPAKAKE